MDVVVGGRKMILTFLYLSLRSCGWQPALSIRSAIVRPLDCNCRSNLERTLSGISPVIHPLGWLKYCTGSLLLSIPSKHLGLSDFQITIAASFSPSAFAMKAIVTRCLAFYHLCIVILSWQSHNLVELSRNKQFHQGISP